MLSDFQKAAQYIVNQRGLIGSLLFQHLQITIIALLVALLIAVPLGVALVRYRWLATPVLGLLGILYTIPSLALLIFFIPIFGLGADNAIATLIIYAQVILVRNTVVGLGAVSPAML